MNFLLNAALDLLLKSGYILFLFLKLYSLLFIIILKNKKNLHSYVGEYF